MDSSRSAVVIGSTGLIGSLLLKHLAHFNKITAISRKPIIDLPKNVQNVVIDLNQAEMLKNVLTGTDLFFCFGTTLKSSGSKEKFIEIEWGLSKKILEIAHQNQIKNIYLVSSMGADSKSSILYSKVKGQIEDLVRTLGFESVVIVRPSLLLGARTEVRLGEGWAQKFLKPIDFLFIGPLLKYRPVEATRVAQYLNECSKNPSLGFYIHENDDLFKKTGT